MIEGVDYAWARPDPDGLAAAGKKFACRYGGPGSAGKQLTPPELFALNTAGIAIVANAEGVADGLRGGREAGRLWASLANNDFRELGMPGDRPIYLSVDFEAGPADWAAIDDALRGAADVIGAARVGVYGGYDTIAHCQAAGSARWFWQTYAWSQGRWHPAAHIQQYRNGVQLAGGVVDLNRAMTADYGQWKIWGEQTMSTFTDVWFTDGIPNWYADKATNPNIKPSTALKNIGEGVLAIRADAAALKLAVSGLAGRPVIDAQALVAALIADERALSALADTIAARVGMLPTAGEIARQTADLIAERLKAQAGN